MFFILPTHLQNMLMHILLGVFLCLYSYGSFICTENVSLSLSQIRFATKLATARAFILFFILSLCFIEKFQWPNVRIFSDHFGFLRSKFKIVSFSFVFAVYLFISFRFVLSRSLMFLSLWSKQKIPLHSRFSIAYKVGMSWFAGYELLRSEQQKKSKKLV